MTTEIDPNVKRLMKQVADDTRRKWGVGFDLLGPHLQTDEPLMAHSQTLWCTCGHRDTLHAASRPHGCRVAQCLCDAFDLRDEEHRDDRRKIKKETS